MLRVSLLALAAAGLAGAGCHAQTTAQAPKGPASGSPYADWRHDAPGVTHRITAAELPPPNVTPSVSVPSGQVPRPAGAELKLPAGFAAKPFAKLDGPRQLRVAPNGDIFVAETDAGRVRVLRAADGAAQPSTVETFVEGIDRPFGIAFYPPGPSPKWVYVATVNSVLRYPYQSGDLKARGPASTVVAKLSPTTRGHTSRDLAFSADGKTLFVSVGSGSNVAEAMPKKTPAEAQAWERQHGLGASWGPEEDRADVLAFDPEGGARRTFASGIRNCVSLTVHPTSHDLWCTTNERDELGDNLPPDYATRVRDKGFYGWPWYYIGNHEDPRHKDERPDLAGKAIVPDVLIQPHSAPLGMVFYTATSGPALFPAQYRGDAFVALHGSWNRAHRVGTKLIRIQLKDGVPTNAYEDFLTGFVVDDHAAWGRPVGLAVAHDGALLMTDDAGDTLWRIAPTQAGGR